MSQKYFLEKIDYNITNSDMSAISRTQEYSKCATLFNGIWFLLIVNNGYIYLKKKVVYPTLKVQLFGARLTLKSNYILKLRKKGYRLFHCYRIPCKKRLL